MADMPPQAAGQGGPRERLRITYAKGEPLKYISHLDLARTWERAFRRAQLPVAHSHGFNPRPRFQIAAALPVGVTGREELLDLWLLEPVGPLSLEARLRPVLPRGLDLLGAVEVELGAPALQSQVVAADYCTVVHSLETADSIRARVRSLMEAPAVPRRRQHKGSWQSYDLRPLIQAIAVEAGAEGSSRITMRLQLSPAGAGRPEEVLDALGLRFSAATLERTRLHFAAPGA